MSQYDAMDRDTLIRLLHRRDAERQLGLVWERDEIEADNALNSDFVTLTLDPALSHGDASWQNVIIEGDNFDALRALRASHKGAIRCIYIDPSYNTGNRDFVNVPPNGIGLYRWDDGAGFYPDFVVNLYDRPGDGIALLEPKGAHLWGLASEVDKSAAAHSGYGRVFMVGRKRGEREFVFLRELGGKLQSDGAFGIDRLRFP